MPSLWPDYASLKNRNEHIRYLPKMHLSALRDLDLLITSVIHTPLNVSRPQAAIPANYSVA